ncbi:MAG: MFS transporter [Acidiferrobacterales bacterium]|nr:MFS transporter [Acidiferrobacterales bacterium]
MKNAETVSPGQAAAARLVPLAALMIVIAAVVLGSLILRAFNKAVDPELSNRSLLIGTIVRADIQRALDLGIPLNQLAGTKTYLEKVLADFPEVSGITVRSADEKIVSRAQSDEEAARQQQKAQIRSDVGNSVIEIPEKSFVFPILTGNELVGASVVEIDRTYVRRQFRNVFLDVLVVILVAILLAVEITITVTATSLRQPLDQLYMLLERQMRGDFSGRLKQVTTTSLGRVAARFSDHAEDLNTRFGRLWDRYASSETYADIRNRLQDLGGRFTLTGTLPRTLQLTDVVDIRLPLFLFAMAEELSKPFLPLYIRSMITGEPWLSEAVIVSLPLIAYLIALVALSPISGFLAERLSPRRACLLALVPVAISHVGLSISSTVAEIILWRGVAGAGYAVATIACQEYALAAASFGRHTRAAAGFVAVVIGGTFCGTAVGGVLADRIGQSNVFLVGAVLIVVAAVVALGMLSAESAKHTHRESGAGVFRGFLSVFRNGRFVALLFGIAIPANVLVATFLWYLVPLMLADLGSSTADIGRALMLYYLLTVIVAPWVARLADRYSSTPMMLTIGGVISGVALMALSRLSGFWPITATIAVAGVAHAFIRAPQIAHALEISRSAPAEGQALMLGALRMFERVGSVFGLLLTAFLVGEIGYTTAVGMTGIGVTTGALLFAVVAGTYRLRTKGEKP